MAAFHHGDTPYSGNSVTSGSVTPIHHFRGREPGFDQVMLPEGLRACSMRALEWSTVQRPPPRRCCLEARVGGREPK